MCQEDILQYLKNKRLMGDDQFYSIEQIKKDLKGSPNYRTWQKINQLYVYGFIEVQVVNWKRYVRAKI